MQLTIWGGAGEHGRSSYLLQYNEEAVLLDCGGKKEGGGQYPLISREVIPQLKAVFLSHAHEDHSMALPLLYKHGYEGEVWTSRVTAQQLPGYFQAWGRYARSQAAELPYRDEHIAAIRYAYLEERSIADEWSSVFPGLRIKWGRSGHLPGAVWLALDWHGKLVYFSGDYTAESGLLAADEPLLGVIGEGADAARRPISETMRIADLAIVDAAYGANPDSQAVRLAELERATEEVLLAQGSVLYPVPTSGRGQELLVWASERFPQARLIVERALMEPLHQLAALPEWLGGGALARMEALLASGRLTIVASEEERLRALARKGSALIFTNDGMMQSEVARWYHQQLSGAAHHAVLLTGHLAAGSYGEMALRSSGRSGSVASGFPPPVQHIRYKVHQGLPDVRQMLERVPSRTTVLAHAVKSRTDGLLEVLKEEGYEGVYSLSPGERLIF
ncbi:RNA processing exonuclease, beta-lactamase fold, Cft2 family [Paenibacillus algorifonticola]|uniref:RNA processing exonuclease, beta-lactamase fold, Cft2 family n=2 Tax=Paenibacillus algorifonticola TaxID=684063 RepID=A0A1I2GD62_9BACL|nr:RNA processing exonuclease, beta-lactamase fold, Cft2 family [Paenibacillus algorifonticola]